MADGRSVKVLIDIVAPGGAEKAKKPLKEVEAENKRINASTASDGKRTAKILEHTTKERIRAELQDEKRLERERKKIANDFIADIKRVERESKNLQSGGGAFKGGFLGGFLGSVGASAISSITSLLSQGASATLNYSKNVESLTIAFEQFAGNAAGAKKQIEELQKLNLETPFGLEALAQASQRLQGVGVESKKAIQLIKDLGNVTAATGKVSVERFDGIVTAITQIISKTKVSAEEMEQLAERGVPAWQILSKHTGNSIAELRKLGEQGKLSSDIMVAALQKVSREKYGDALEKQNKTLEGSLNRIKNVLLEASRTWFKPIYDEASRFGATFAERITANETKTKTFMENFGFSLGQSFKRGVDSGFLSIQSVVDALLTGGGLTQAGIQAGRGIAEGYNTPQGALPNTGQNTGMENYDPYGTFNGKKVVEAQKKMFDELGKEAEKAQKDREALAKAELSAQIGLYQTQISRVQGLYKESFDKLVEGFKETNNPAQFEQSFQELKSWYGEQVNSLVPAWEELVRKQTLAEKKGQNERQLVYEETQDKIADITKTTFDLEDQAKKVLADSTKKFTEQQIKDAEDKARKTIELAGMTAEIEKKLAEEVKTTEIKAITESQAAEYRYLQTKKEVYEKLLKDARGNAEKEAEIKYELQKIDLEIKEQQLETSIKFGEATRREAEKSADLMREYTENELEKAKKAAEELKEQQKRLYEQTTDFFEDKLQSFADRGFKGLFQSLLDDLKDFLIKAAAQIAASKFLKFLTGQNINGNSGGGFSLGNIFSGLFGGGGGIGGTPNFNPNAGGGLGSLVGGAGQAGGILASIFGLGAGSAAVGGTATAGAGALSGLGGAAAGTGGGILGGFGGLGALMTNPWTIGIAAAAIGGFALFKLFSRGKAEKKLKAAAMSEFGINVGDKKLLTNIKKIARAYGINVKDDATAKQAVNLEESRDMLEAYAESTGQSTEKINKDKYSDPDFAGNNFSASGGRSSASSFSSGGFSSPSTTATAKTPSPQTGMFGYFVEVVERLERKISSMNPGDVVTVGASQAKDAIFEANQDAITSNGRRSEFVRRDLGEQFG